VQCDFEKSFFGDYDAGPVEFGADQCKRTVSLFLTNPFMGLILGILVRDDATKTRLNERLGGNSTIM
jgi:hypothetical protein